MCPFAGDVTSSATRVLGSEGGTTADRVGGPHAPWEGPSTVIHRLQESREADGNMV